MKEKGRELLRNLVGVLDEIDALMSAVEQDYAEKIRQCVSSLLEDDVDIVSLDDPEVSALRLEHEVFAEVILEPMAKLCQILSLMEDKMPRSYARITSYSNPLSFFVTPDLVRGYLYAEPQTTVSEILDGLDYSSFPPSHNLIQVWRPALRVMFENANSLLDIV